MTIEPLEVQAELSRRLYMLAPLAVARRHSELVRGGLPARSMSDGPRGGEAPLPVMQPVTRRNDDGAPMRWGEISQADAVDREANRRAKKYARHFINALRELDAAYEEQTWFMEVAERLPDHRPMCSNLRCDKELEEGRNTGECGRCRKWRSVNRAPYPMEPVEK